MAMGTAMGTAMGIGLNANLAGLTDLGSMASREIPQ